MPVTRSLHGVDSRYRTVAQNSLRALSANLTGAGVFAATTAGTLAVETLANGGWQYVYIDPDDLAVSGRTTKLRLAAACGVQDNAPAITLTVGLYPVGTPSGGTNVFDANLGAVVTGTTIAFATPAANSASAQSYTTDIALPAEGWYALGVAASGAMAANSVVIMPTRVEVRNV